MRANPVSARRAKRKEIRQILENLSGWDERAWREAERQLANLGPAGAREFLRELDRPAQSASVKLLKFSLLLVVFINSTYGSAELLKLMGAPAYLSNGIVLAVSSLFALKITGASRRQYDVRCILGRMDAGESALTLLLALRSAHYETRSAAKVALARLLPRLAPEALVALAGRPHEAVFLGQVAGEPVADRVVRIQPR